jgi:hypothetical protein
MDDEIPNSSVRITAYVLGRSFSVPTHLCSVSAEGTVILSPDLQAFFRIVKTLTGVDGSLAIEYPLTLHWIWPTAPAPTADSLPTIDYPLGGAPDG